MTQLRSGCPAFLRGFPGAVVEVSADGVVLDSNGRLEEALGTRALVGRPFAELLDAASSLAKWERLLGRGPGEPSRLCELVLRGEDSLPEPRAFSVLPDAEAGGLWLVEHPRDPRLDRLGREVTETNSELAVAQRALSKEGARLARALAALEERTRQLEESNQALDQFAHVVSHDLKAPLRSIGNYAHWIAEDAGDALGPEAADHLARLRQRVLHMEGLVRGILEYSRAGRDPAPSQEVDTEALLREVVEVLAPAPPARVEVETPLPTVRGHRLPLEQVLQNLVGNALKYARVPEPLVRVGAVEREGFYEFYVGDNGPGVPPRLQERIWSLFFTGRAAPEPESTGIGLAVVRKLVERQGGRAWVESTPGAGATFRFLWPREAGDPPHPQERA